jgi:ubiquinone/menaquinone biosynthesis C-methylase UbiE
MLDGQALPYPDNSLDAVICQLGLMFFTDPARGLSEFYRVLRNGGWAAVSVTTGLDMDLPRAPRGRSIRLPYALFG